MLDLLTSFAVIIISAFLLGQVLKKIKLPPLVGMLVIGIIFGPYVLNLISPTIINISSDLRQLALIIILTRAGLNLDLDNLKKNGRSAIMLCFIPATIEIGAYILFGYLILKIDVLSASILGCVIAAVSPAVVVPRMLKLKEERYGIDKGIPDMIMAGASVDDVYVIVLFTTLCAMGKGDGFSFHIFWQLPVSIIFGVGFGIGIGLLFLVFINKFKMGNSIKVLIILALTCLFIFLQHSIEKWVPFSGLLAVISFAAVIYKNNKECANSLSDKYNKIWIFAEIVLFVLVGAEVDVSFAFSLNGLMVIPILFIALIFRMGGVFICVLGTKLNFKERLFTMIAYCPKATVQAAIGAIPLTMGLSNGQLILTAAVIAILITAPLGAFSIDLSYKKLLTKAIDENIKTTIE